MLYVGINVGCWMYESVVCRNQCWMWESVLYVGIIVYESMLGAVQESVLYVGINAVCGNHCVGIRCM